MKLIAKIIIVPAEEAGKDFGLGNGVTEIARMIVSDDPVRATVQMANYENKVHQQLIRIDWEECTQ